MFYCCRVCEKRVQNINSINSKTAINFSLLVIIITGLSLLLRIVFSKIKFKENFEKLFFIKPEEN